ncbi:hypothetical protein OG618_00285 [Kitasatospora sp. NBC_01246]|uniref:hypothetical protein n=1 Tax=Kitasatospora sp. NBC_01246 TaxID=2903570 RepID=UPI002E375A92|nr:hypothetical protein [Kitasatospora sp. NBC_01246]
MSGQARDAELSAGESPVDWLRIKARKHAARILQTVKLRAFNPRATEWQRMFALAPMGAGPASRPAGAHPGVLRLAPGRYRASADRVAAVCAGA